jgi:hypothetical protein
MAHSSTLKRTPAKLTEADRRERRAIQIATGPDDGGGHTIYVLFDDGTIIGSDSSLGRWTWMDVELPD